MSKEQFRTKKFSSRKEVLSFKKIRKAVIKEMYSINRPILNLAGFVMVLLLSVLFLNGVHVWENNVLNDFQTYVIVFIMIIYILLIVAYLNLSEGFFPFIGIFCILLLAYKNTVWINIAIWYVCINIAIYTFIICKKVLKDSKRKKSKTKTKSKTLREYLLGK